MVPGGVLHQHELVLVPSLSSCFSLHYATKKYNFGLTLTSASSLWLLHRSENLLLVQVFSCKHPLR